MRRKRFAWLAIALTLIAAPAFGQGAGTSASITGVVTDHDGGRIPGATVVIKNDATQESKDTITNSQGIYSFPALDPGTYTITITLSSFKTVVMKDVRLLAATPRTMSNAVLEVGGLTETVEVKGGSELIRTETATVSQTINTEFIRSLPRSDRNVLNFLVLLPGVETTGANARGSTISGLPQNTINITLDGVSQSNNLQTTDGFFTLVTPRLDAIEEVTMTTAAAGADSSGQGATQIRFVTKSGTNQYQSSVYEYFRHNSLNTNTFFNRLAGLPKPRVTVNQYGGRIGGPIIIPGVYDGRGKAFFFFNYEESWQPNAVRRTRTILQESARTGLFSYNLTNPTTVNLLALAGANGQTATMDPTVQALLASMRSSVAGAVSGNTGSVTTSTTDPIRETFNYLSEAMVIRHSPTGRVDLNLSDRHRLTGSYYWQGFSDDPDTLNNFDSQYPGFPKGVTASFRTNGSTALRSTFSSNMVNNLTGGWQWTPEDFFGSTSVDLFQNQNFYALTLPLVSSPNPNGVNSPSTRTRVNWNIDDQLSWLRGAHNFSFGFSFSRFEHTGENWSAVPSVGLGLNTTNDPAAALFTTANFPGASNTDLTNARSLYALLTGRVTQLGATARLNEAGDEFIYNGHLVERVRMDEYGMFAQDSWRLRPNLTLTLGLRYELQMPLAPTNGRYTTSTMSDLCGPSGEGNYNGRQCNLFAPGQILNPGSQPTFVFYEAGKPGYAIDKNNFAPNIGASWRPNVRSGWLRPVLGDPEVAVVSGGFTRSFNRERLDRFTAVFGGNPGGTVPATRGTGSGQFALVGPNETWPFLYRDCTPDNGGRCYQPPFQTTPSFPIVATTAQSIRVFDPVIQVPYTDSWNVGLQRSLSASTAIEVRYIGNVNRKPWTTEDWNNENIIENGLLDEFRLAQANLHANLAAGRGGTFAYFGAGTGTSPLPIFLTHFAGVDGRVPSIGGDASRYTSTNFTNATFVNALDPYDPDPYGVAADLWGTAAFRTNMTTAGFPSNFWVLNPLVDGAVVTRNLERGSTYHSIQVDLRRRFSGGFQINGSYTFARRFTYSIPNADYHNDFLQVQSANVPHAFKVLWVYELPVGRGHRFGTGMSSWLDAIVGGWQFSGTGRAQLPIVRLTNTNIVGMTKEEAQEMFKTLRFETNPTNGSITVWNVPQDIYTNTRLAYDTSATQLNGYAPGLEPQGRYFQPATGPTCTLNPGAIAFKSGDCAPDLIFYSAWFAEFDFKAQKRFPFGRKANFEFSVEVFNALNATNFNRNLTPGSAASTFQITGQASGARVGQLVWRFNF